MGQVRHQFGHRPDQFAELGLLLPVTVSIQPAALIADGGKFVLAADLA